MNYEEQQANIQIQKDKEEFDAAKRPERAEKVIDFLEKIGAYDFFHKLDSDENEVSFDNFKSFLIRLNGIAREIPIKQRKFDGQNVEITGGLLNETILPPRSEDKEDLLKLAFDSSRELSKEDSSYMLPAVINEVHMFVDGNGRTSRIIHLLLSDFDKDTFDTELQKALGSEGRFDCENINPRHIDFEIEKNVLARHDWYFDPETQKVLGHDKLKGGIASALYPNVDQKTPFGENLKKFKKIAESDLYYLLTAIVENLSEEKYEAILLRDESKPKIDGKLISPEHMKALSDNDWHDIFNGYFRLKKEHVETLIDIFKYPNSYMSNDNNQETLKDLFIRKIKEEYVENNKTK